MSEFGIDKLKEALTFLAQFGKKIEDALADGKFTLIEGVTLGVSAVPQVFSLVTGATQLKQEYLDLDDTEREQLAAHLATQLDLSTGEKVEEIAEAGFEFLLALDAFIKTVRETLKD